MSSSSSNPASFKPASALPLTSSRDARFDALVSIGEEDAAREMINEDLDELLP